MIANYLEDVGLFLLDSRKRRCDSFAYFRIETGGDLPHYSKLFCLKRHLRLLVCECIWNLSFLPCKRNRNDIWHLTIATTNSVFASQNFKCGGAWFGRSCSEEGSVRCTALNTYRLIGSRPPSSYFFPYHHSFSNRPSSWNKRTGHICNAWLY